MTDTTDFSNIPAASDYDDQPKEALSETLTVPTITVYACGGAGISALRETENSIAQHVTAIKRICTADVDLRPGEDAMMVSGTQGSGSGTIRAANANSIIKYVASLSDEDLGYSDINIIMTSMSGGSGSVISPELVREINRRSKGNAAFIFMGIGHTVSETFTKNTLNTLKSMVSLCNTQKVYLPTMLFDNTHVGDHVVNKTIMVRLTQLVYLLGLATYNLDRADRRNFLNGMKTVGAAPGMRLLKILTTDGEDDEVNTGEIFRKEDGEIYDALLGVGHTTESGVVHHVPFHDHVRHLRKGVFKAQSITALAAVITSSDSGVASLLRDIGDTLARFESQSKNVSSVIDLDGTSDEGGRYF